MKASSPEVPPVANAPDPSQPDLPSRKPGAPDMMRAPAPILPKPTGSIAGAADAQARAMTGLADAAPSLPSCSDEPRGRCADGRAGAFDESDDRRGDAPRAAPEPTLHQMNAGAETRSAVVAERAASGRSRDPQDDPAVIERSAAVGDSRTQRARQLRQEPREQFRRFDGDRDAQGRHARRRAADSSRVRQIDLQGLQYLEHQRQERP